VYSEEGQGTVFKIYLPLAEAAPEAPAGRAPAPSRASGVVLVVEDEPGVRAMAVRALREAGYSVRAADCAAAGLREVVAAGASLTCIVTDVIMPDLDGRTFARQVAERWDGPVLFMSGYTETDIVLRGLLQEQLPFLQKPFPPQRLVEVVGQLVTGRAGQP
jgi:DNA-binding response OmpR family regulator